MKKYIAIALLGWAWASMLRADLWSEDFDKALMQAKESGKYTLVDFSGSDWCGWCKKMDKEVFSQQEFKDFAKSNLVCVLLDFPRQKPQSEKQKEVNRALMNKYAVRGFPTILLLGPHGDLAAKIGYEPGGAKAYVKQIQRLIDQHKDKQPRP